MKRVAVFILSIVLALGFLQLERAAGIEWDFHPDAVTYTTEFLSYTSEGLAEVPNNLYFYVSSLVDGDVTALIGINILLFALCNAIALPRSSETAAAPIRARLSAATWLWLLFMAQPYRWHLSVHALKDTLIIFLLLIATRVRWASLPAFGILLLTRIAAVFYVLLKLPRKVLIGSFAIGCVIALLSPELTEWLILRNEVDMGGREFDAVPTFVELGEWGSLIRGVTWPLLLVTGGFLALSPSMSFAPVAVEMITQRLGTWWASTRPLPWLEILACLAIIALLVTSFTSFIRYCYPVLSVIPVLAMQLKPGRTPGDAQKGQRSGRWSFLRAFRFRHIR